LKKSNIDSNDFTEKLEEKIVELSLQLKGLKNELNCIHCENHKHIKNIVHNLKNPIGVSYSFSEMLEEGGMEISSEKRKKYVDIIKNSSDYSLKLLNSIGELNRLKSPKFRLNKKPTNYNDLVNKLINQFNEDQTAENISLKEFSNNTILLNIDEEEITKVINLILNNACRYSQNKTLIRVTIHETDTTVETEIIDNGIGISDNNLDTIFDKFSAVNTYSENGQKCVGLGLSIAKKIIQLHNGQISVHSNFGSGSTFKFILPKK